MAIRFRMSRVSGQKGQAIEKGVMVLSGLLSAGVVTLGNHFSRFPPSFKAMVSWDLVFGAPEDGGERCGTPKDSGFGQL